MSSFFFWLWQRSWRSLGFSQSTGKRPSALQPQSVTLAQLATLQAPPQSKSKAPSTHWGPELCLGRANPKGPHRILKIRAQKLKHKIDHISVSRSTGAIVVLAQTWVATHERPWLALVACWLAQDNHGFLKQYLLQAGAPQYSMFEGVLPTWPAVFCQVDPPTSGKFLSKWVRF